MSHDFDMSEHQPPSRISAQVSWYDLFSRGARDWLRHNEKVREAVKRRVGEFIASPGVLTRAYDQTLLVPVRMLEHARFRLREGSSETGAGQGAGNPGDVLRPARPQSNDSGEGEEGGTGEGEVNFVLELRVEDILDWLWDEMKLPQLKPKRSGASEDSQYTRAGWDRRGARSRLDRRRTVKEAVKRRAVQESPLPFTDDDLRFRQLVRRRQPAVDAAVVFAIDVSGSMGEAERHLAKMFFFFALQGIRRQYPKVATAFVGHTIEAWEFTEEEFFQVTGTGGTAASSAFNLAFELFRDRFDAAHYNRYLFYCSDGENSSQDHDAAAAALERILPDLNYLGYLETRPSHGGSLPSEMANILAALARDHTAIGIAQADSQDDVWAALRRFFQQQIADVESA